MLSCERGSKRHLQVGLIGPGIAQKVAKTDHFMAALNLGNTVLPHGIREKKRRQKWLNELSFILVLASVATEAASGKE